MKVSFWTFDGHKIEYDTLGNPLTLDHINHIGKEYLAYTREMPTRVYLGINVYDELIPTIYNPGAAMMPLSKDKLYLTTSLSSIGIVQLIPVTKPNVGFLLVGQEKDYERYLVDEIFEKEALT